MRNCNRTIKTASRRAGSMLGLVAISLVVLIAVAGLAFDGGLLMYHRRQAQTASDAAAMAAAIELSKGASVTSAKDTARTYAAYNGYSNDGTSNTVVVNIPPTSGPNSGNAKYAEVLCTRNISTSLIKVVFSGTAYARSRGVSHFEIPSSGAALLLRRPNTDSTLKFSGDAIVEVTGDATVVVNSNAGKAADGSGNAKIIADEIQIVGDYQLSGSAQLQGTITTGAAPGVDPLASLPAPNPGTLTVRSNNKLDVSSGTQTLQPGVYTGGIDISGSGSVTLAPGVYYMNDGDLKVTGSGFLQGNGVMIYMEQKLYMQNTGSVNLTPSTSGTYSGVTLWGAGYDSNGEFDISGGTNLQIQGDIYAPNAFIKLSGNSGTAALGSRVIAWWLEVTGNSRFNINYNSSGSGASTASLVE